jgi:hypothetical protein
MHRVVRFLIQSATLIGLALWAAGVFD